MTLTPRSPHIRSLFLFGEKSCNCCRQFTTSATVYSGHSRWSKIKHDKGVADSKKNARRSEFARELTLVSKLGGPDPKINFKLAHLITIAKKDGFPKESIEKAIARGQGKSATGAALENVSLEFMMASKVAMILDAETDSRMRTLANLKSVIKRHGGSVTPTNYLFQKKGRLCFEKDGRKLEVDDVLEEAVEAGAEDIETDEDGNLVVWTEPTQITATAAALEKTLELKVKSLDILWDPNEDTKVPLADEDSVKGLSDFLEALEEFPEIQGVYANAAQGNVELHSWEDFEAKLYA